MERIFAAFADKAYFKKEILDMVKKDKALPYIPVNASTYKINEEHFRCNKDSDQWYRKTKGILGYYEYAFDIDDCKNCPNKSNCITKGKVRKLHIGINTN